MFSQARSSEFYNLMYSYTLIKRKGDKMLNKYLIIISMSIIFIVSVQLINAQEKPVKVKGNKTMVQGEDMQNLMNKIAADSTMRMQMIGKMMNDEHSRSVMINKMFSKVYKDSLVYNEMRNYLRTHSKVKNMMQSMMNKNDMMRGTGMTDKKDMMKGSRTMKYQMMSDSTMTRNNPD